MLWKRFGKAMIHSQIKNAHRATVSSNPHVLLIGIALLTFGCHSPSQSLTVYAAASLSAVLPDAAEEFPTPVIFNFAASSTLARQIENGAPADLFFSANVQWVDYLEAKAMIIDGARKTFLSNHLVIVQKDSHRLKCTTEQLAEKTIKRIAIGDWNHVPAGMYAKNSLESMKLWTVVQDKLLPALNVRAAATYVSQQAADCALVYQTDVALFNDLVVSQIIPAIHQPNIQYTLTIPKQSKHHHSQELFQYLQDEDAQKQYKKHGFVFKP